MCDLFVYINSINLFYLKIDNKQCFVFFLFFFSNSMCKTSDQNKMFMSLLPVYHCEMTSAQPTVLKLIQVLFYLNQSTCSNISQFFLTYLLFQTPLVQICHHFCKKASLLIIFFIFY